MDLIFDIWPVEFWTLYRDVIELASRDEQSGRRAFVKVFRFRALGVRVVQQLWDFVGAWPKWVINVFLIFTLAGLFAPAAVFVNFVVGMGSGVCLFLLVVMHDSLQLKLI